MILFSIVESTFHALLHEHTALTLILLAHRLPRLKQQQQQQQIFDHF